MAGSFGGAPAGISSRLHTEESGQPREESTGEKSKRHPWILGVEAVSHNGKYHGEDNENDEHYLILLFQVCHGTLAHVLSNLYHTRCSFIGFHHGLEEVPCHT